VSSNQVENNVGEAVDDGTSVVEHHRENPLRVEKRRKLEGLREAGIDPFPHDFKRDLLSDRLRADFEVLAAGEKKPESVFRMAGRLMSRRLMGKASFFNLQDGPGPFQCYFRQAESSETEQKIFDLLDIGDFVGVEGYPFRTKTGELSLHVNKIQILCKTLEPLPEKFHGIADIEIKYRHRHLDLIMDESSRQVFRTRAQIITGIRDFFDKRDFLEVETPILQPIYGGAAARPFTTHHNTLDMKLYMKISPELYLKRLIVGGLEKVYDLNRNFRNEGIDRSHNPEFTMLEWYEAYTDYHYQMKQFEELTVSLCEKIRGTTKFEYQGREIDFTPPWPKISVMEGVAKHAGLDPLSASTEQIVAAMKSRGSKVNLHEALSGVVSRGQLLMELFELTVEETLWNPTFVVDHPEEISPLTKKHRLHKGLVERFEPFAACMEIGNGYTELNDPVDQRDRLEAQERVRTDANEAHPMDEDFMHAIEVGMPPTGGVGFGVERIVMILTDRPSIRDIILFPTMRRT
jgi:lysyl-tRNA synthetase class 2